MCFAPVLDHDFVYCLLRVELRILSCSTGLGNWEWCWHGLGLFCWISLPCTSSLLARLLRLVCGNQSLEVTWLEVLHKSPTWFLLTRGGLCADFPIKSAGCHWCYCLVHCLQLCT
ncbi:unnamed protein product [Cuscuta campestris]|uniref:Uncharacterized protein n=1 Tax=Cuscuta campestris TaxID=132261 RepID=A0A484NMR4_9ASTE|nr:unnamed protein product [Cuscuta campestris]